ncbi:Gfo/Idh/MocA family oxidoreductase [Kaistia dalseonensis]|uniref:Dehydrogenase n=1 Tax=Kaistia dalseonensis TaxID=410840 RepID=A0ABU0HB93_9HYPH|nr:Gfo/Idh/MocA family oxidoreductase [Kaistia dalseonensis]MCX5496152.1 Gfo/Idh/MocA family oxidoreductase [Kaistia dalseonensis]MDQ0438761.1 putative dehydrogenase [Kaistia dalseonensis]
MGLSPRSLRVGLIGAGAIGSWHARIVSERPDADLVAICDLDAVRAEALAARFGGDAYTDAAALFASAALDAVILASPESVHVEQALLAAAAGVPMLIEKPVAADLAGIAAIRAAAQAAGVAVMAGHVERFEIGSAQLKTAVDEGVCGRLVSIAARRQFVALEMPRFKGISTTLRILGVHDFDLITWIHPVQIAEVYAAAGRGRIFEETGLDDHVMTTIRFADGAVALVESAWTLPAPYGAFQTPDGWSPAGNNRLDVFGATGMVSNDMSLRGQQLIAFDEQSGFRAAGIRHQPLLHGRVVGALAEEVSAFLRMVAEKSAPIVGLDDAERAVALTSAAEASLASGLPVRPTG